jgi:uncharacterized protein
MRYILFFILFYSLAGLAQQPRFNVVGFYTAKYDPAQKDLKSNPDISILLSVDPKSFPLGTGPKQHEIWYSGYYPIAWTNKKYKMIYTNMGHNDMDYEGKTNAQLTSTFSSPEENKFIINSLMWLGGVKN